jgi:hypothetical protein
MNEAETRAEHIDPAVKAAGWGVVEGSRIRRETLDPAMPTPRTGAGFTASTCRRARYPTPEELWALTFAGADEWRDRFAAIPFEDKAGSHPSRILRLRRFEDCRPSDGRAGGIRTRDLLNPIQAHYQAVLRPVFGRAGNLGT